MDGQYDKAAKTLEDLNFLVGNISKNQAENIMVKAVYYYASAMDKLKSHEEAMYYIEMLFDENIAKCIDESFKDRDNILQNHYGITQEDYVDNNDSYYLPFMETLRKAQKENVVDQMTNKIA